MIPAKRPDINIRPYVSFKYISLHELNISDPELKIPTHGDPRRLTKRQHDWSTAERTDPALQAAGAPELREPKMGRVEQDF